MSAQRDCLAGGYLSQGGSAADAIDAADDATVATMISMVKFPHERLIESPVE
jgi:hypothetical protein